MKAHFLKTSLSLISAVLITACSDSSNQSDNGLITLNITDAPVDTAEAVVVEFSGVTLKSEGDDDITFTFDTPKSIDLLSLQGTQSQALLENVEIPTGNYSQIRLAVNAEFDGEHDSYITINSVQHELRVPGGSQSGLKLNTPFTIAAGTEGISVADENSVYTIDFDLRKSIVKPNGQDGYFLKPVLRLVQNTNTGSISGTVDSSLLTGVNCSDADPLTGNAVYVFEGANTTPDDVDGVDAEPITTSLLTVDTSTQNTTVYTYEVGFLAAGDYTLAFICTADLDNDENNDNVVFDVTDNVTVIANQNVDHPIN